MEDWGNGRMEEWNVGIMGKMGHRNWNIGLEPEGSRNNGIMGKMEECGNGKLE